MTKIKPSVAKYLAEIAAKGGRKSRRKLTSKNARAMAKKRWAKAQKGKR